MKKEHAFLPLEYRLMNKPGLNLLDKVLLTFITGLIDKGNEVNATNEKLGKLFATSPKSISRSITKLFEKGFIQCDFPNGVNREITITSDNMDVINRFIEGTTEAKVDKPTIPTPQPKTIEEDVPDFVIAEVDIPMDKTKPREVEEYIQPKRPPAPNMDREPTPEEMVLIRKRKRVYQVSNGKPSDFLNEMEIDELSKKCKKPGVTPLKILLSCQGYDIGMGKTTFQWKESELQTI